MKSTTAGTFATRTMLVALAAGTFLFAATPKAQAQNWSVGVQLGQPVYGYYDNDYRRAEEYREHEAREAYARQQAYIQHERWEEEQREAYARQQAYIQHERWEEEQREAYARQQAYLQHERQERWQRYRHQDDDDDR